MTAHSRLGASSAKRWMTCPGSFKLHEEAPHGGTSVYAAAGTVAHALAETALELGEAADKVPVGQFVQNQGHEIVVDEEMRAAIGVYLDAVRARVSAGIESRHEQRVTLNPWWAGETPPPVPMFGTVDTWIWRPRSGCLTIMDFKYGSGVYVQHTDNPQLLYYAAGALLLVPRDLVRTVELVVVQPRARGQDPVRSETIDALDLRVWIDTQLKPAVAAVQDPDAPLVPGAHCRFCAAKPTCPARANMANDRAREDFPEEPEGAGLSRLSQQEPDNFAF